MHTSDFWWKKRDLPKRCPKCGTKVKHDIKGDSFGALIADYYTSCHPVRYTDKRWNLFRWGLECMSCNMVDMFSEESIVRKLTNNSWSGTVPGDNSIRF